MNAAPLLTIENPKRRRSTLTGWADLFPYYAGYPEEFASKVIASAGLKAKARVYDPWNGSGSTTSAAASLGRLAIGFDINPVMVVVAKARLLPPGEWSVLRPLSRRILQHARALDTAGAGDDLNQWFSHRTTSYLRRLELSVRDHLMETEALPVDVSTISSLASIFYVALFSAARALAGTFKSSNPTWLRVAKNPEDRLDWNRVEVERCFLDAVERARSACRDVIVQNKAVQRVRVETADSTIMRPRKGTIDFILTSPPYCTRIDYTAATRVELAVLSPLVSDDRRSLSARMLGSIRVPKDYPRKETSWGPTALAFLEKVGSHPSHASDTYYLKSHLDYFCKLQQALAQCEAALRSGARAVFVVQDSRYKGIHNDLQTTVIEMCSSLGMHLAQRQDFDFKCSMRDVNSRSRSYGATGAVQESALVFRKL
jgi:hypothetical protein